MSVQKRQRLIEGHKHFDIAAQLTEEIMRREESGIFGVARDRNGAKGKGGTIAIRREAARLFRKSAKAAPDLDSRASRYHLAAISYGFSGDFGRALQMCNKEARNLSTMLRFAAEIDDN